MPAWSKFMLDRMVLAVKPGLTKRELKRKAVYSTLGLIPFFANFGIKEAFQMIGAPLAIAGIVGYIAGGQINYPLHYRITWGDHTKATIDRSRWRKYTFGNVCGLGINLTALLFYTHLLSVMDWQWAAPLIAFSAAVCTSWVFNYTWNHRVAFAVHKHHHPAKSVADPGRIAD